MAKRLTIPEVRARRDMLEAMVQTRDYEAAGNEERQIWEDVLEAIRDGAPQSKGLANNALATRNIEFPRGYGA